MELPLITAKISACTAVSYLFVKESQSDGTAHKGNPEAA